MEDSERTQWGMSEPGTGAKASWDCRLQFQDGASLASLGGEPGRLSTGLAGTDNRNTSPWHLLGIRGWYLEGSKQRLPELASPGDQPEAMALQGLASGATGRPFCHTLLTRALTKFSPFHRA